MEPTNAIPEIPGLQFAPPSVVLTNLLPVTAAYKVPEFRGSIATSVINVAVSCAAGRSFREGLHTSLTDLRPRKNYNSARARWQQEICRGPALFVMGRDKGKPSHFWRHAYQVARSGRYLGSVVNPDTGSRVEVGDGWLTTAEFRKARLSEVIGGDDQKEECADLKSRRPICSPLWQADGKRIRRVAPLDFIGRYEPATFCTTSLCN